MLPKALKSGPKSNKSPNLVTLMTTAPVGMQKIRLEAFEYRTNALAVVISPWPYALTNRVKIPLKSTCSFSVKLIVKRSKALERF